MADPNLFECTRAVKRRGPYSTAEKVKRCLWETKIIRSASGCWEWQGKRNKQGYAITRLDGRDWLGHRASFFLATGTDPGTLLVMHSCDNPCCVNPEHLTLGTHLDNMRDCVAKGRTKRIKTNFGESHHDAKLTWKQVREIRRRYAQGGISCVKLAMEYGVHGTNIHQIVSGQTWKEDAK